LDILNRCPTDIYPLGTIVRFAANNNTTKWHYLKVGEESWSYLESRTVDKELARWILEAMESTIGYFEVYVLTVAATPIFTQA